MSLVHWGIVICLVTVLFGKNKISSVMKDLGGGIKEFKKGMSSLSDEDNEPLDRIEDKSNV